MFYKKHNLLVVMSYSDFCKIQNRQEKANTYSWAALGCLTGAYATFGGQFLVDKLCPKRMMVSLVLGANDDEPLFGLSISKWADYQYHMKELANMRTQGWEIAEISASLSQVLRGTLVASAIALGIAAVGFAVAASHEDS